MTQPERLEYLIGKFKNESARYRDLQTPRDTAGKRRLLRSLMNVRPPRPMDLDALRVQDEYLSERVRENGVVSLWDIPTAAEQGSRNPEAARLSLWQGDITTLKCGAIVNAANSGMTGCYQPCHSCIDNCIHTYAGVQLRSFCADMMEKQGFEEPTGQAKITPAFNLPCDFVIHTVGPIVGGSLQETHREQLASCYRSCLRVADENGVGSIAFCCISTGVFGFPQREAAGIAVRTVKGYRAKTGSRIEVIFNVFRDADYEIYRALFR
ncbi:MAG: protein-ADP-ribose hydrolase [Clostridia bacterium]|nr:protein-ADP-ribose hydrolase [Clostridia bacterium]